MINKENLAKSLISRTELKKGHTITKDDVEIKSPGQGLAPNRLSRLIGKTLRRDMLAEEFFYESDLNEHHITPREYKFDRPWGILFVTMI